MASSSRDIEPFTRWKILTIITTMHLNFSNQVLCKFIFLVICVTSYFIFIYKLLFGSWTIRGWESWEKFIKVKASYTETAFVIYDIDDDLFFFQRIKIFESFLSNIRSNIWTNGWFHFGFFFALIFFLLFFCSSLSFFLSCYAAPYPRYAERFLFFAHCTLIFDLRFQKRERQLVEKYKHSYAEKNRGKTRRVFDNSF